MKILITGSSGMLGHDLIEVLKDKHDLILSTSKTLDITDKDKTVEFIRENKPDIVIIEKGCDSNKEEYGAFMGYNRFNNQFKYLF